MILNTKYFTLLTVLSFHLSALETRSFELDAHFLETIQKFDPESSEIREFLVSLVELESTLDSLTFFRETRSDTHKIASTLNSLQDLILNSDDLELIQLFQRAIRNFNSFSEDQANPFTQYYKHYRAPTFFVPKIDLIIDVKEEEVTVTTELSVKRNSSQTKLVLDGRDQAVQSVHINGKLIKRENYKVTKHELILAEIPEEETFDVKIVSQINPFQNDSLEGMYLCQGWLTTQCESEGARRIFFTLDRPDVLSTITTTILADKKQYPYRLSNGNLIHETEVDDGRTLITWQDPFPKPSYLFACVLGKFSLLTSNFKTRSGMDVELQVYLEPGKESRGEYALIALKKAMEFDELFFDREYDLSCLKMVGIPDFNSGAMENKGLMIFNDRALLVDEQSGTDAAFRNVAKVIAHEYFHNWSGNRVTVRNWFEIALKEAFTDWRANRFGEWMFGEEFLRPKDVCALKEIQFPEEYSEHGHPIMVASYVDAHSIYDSTTYTKGREIFRTFEIYVNSLISDGFREVLNIYFAENDGKAVTFKELLKAADVVLARVGQDSSQFERWFHQPGTPLVEVEINYLEDQKVAQIHVKQSCKHPKTQQLQLPYIIPFSIELLGEEGIILPKQEFILDSETRTFEFSVSEKPTPIFMHGLSAPVNLEYAYSAEELKLVMKYTQDAYSRWEAAQKYSKITIHHFLDLLRQQESDTIDIEKIKSDFSSDFQVYKEILGNSALSPLSKVQLVQIPSLRALSQAYNEFDFVLLKQARHLFRKCLTTIAKNELEVNFQQSKTHDVYQPTAEQMQLRELHNTCLSLLLDTDEKYDQELLAHYFESDNFNDQFMAFANCVDNKNCEEKISDDFYEKWKEDKAVFNYWLSTYSSSSKCTPEELLRLEKVQGYHSKNPNHIRALVCGFMMNLSCYHDKQGLGYHYVVNKIIEVSEFNPMLAHNYIAAMAFQDFDNLPESQQLLMVKELKRLKEAKVSSQTKDLAQRILKRYSNS